VLGRGGHLGADDRASQEQDGENLVDHAEHSCWLVNINTP
jgi:hypothetical protein